MVRDRVMRRSKVDGDSGEREVRIGFLSAPMYMGNVVREVKLYKTRDFH